MLAIFKLAHQLAETRIVAHRIEVVIFAHIAKISIAQLDGPAQCLDGLLGPFQEREAAREIVMCQCVIGPQPHKPFVDVEPLGETALEGQQIAHDAKHVNVVGMAGENSAEEIEFKV